MAGWQFQDLNEEDRFPLGPLRIDVAALYQRMPPVKSADARPGLVPAYEDAFHRWIYRRRPFSLAFRRKAKEILRRTNLDDHWLKHFQEYWVALGGRPLWHVSDFFFLRNFYRIRKPPSHDQEAENSEQHLDLWQDPHYLQGLFHAVLRETFSTAHPHMELLQYHNPDWNSVLEFGAGSAPITSSIVQFGFLRPGSVCVIADLPILSFHYATFKFRHCANVEPLLLSPGNDFQLDTGRTFDAIFCCQVFEHLNSPMATARRFLEALRPGGLLFFDYILSDAQGLDTRAGLEERGRVLDFFADVCRIEYGVIRKEASTGLVVGRKKS